MEPRSWGEVIVSAKVENYWDRREAERGAIGDDQVRRIEIANARVDQRETRLCLPSRIIEQLGLDYWRIVRERTAAGLKSVRIFELVNLNIQGRDCSTEVKEIADDETPIIGIVPLAQLDWVVDTEEKKLIGNPDHGGDRMSDMYHQESCV